MRLIGSDLESHHISWTHDWWGAGCHFQYMNDCSKTVCTASEPVNIVLMQMFERKKKWHDAWELWSKCALLDATKTAFHRGLMCSRITFSTLLPHHLHLPSTTSSLRVKIIHSNSIISKVDLRQVGSTVLKTFTVNYILHKTSSVDVLISERKLWRRRSDIWNLYFLMFKMPPVHISELHYSLVHLMLPFSNIYANWVLNQGSR